MKAIVNTTLVLENSLVWDGVLLFDQDRIIACGPAEQTTVPPGATIIDAGGRYTAPGLIDIHNHGGHGRLFSEDPIHCCDHFLQHGQTTVLPTLYASLSYQELLDAIKLIHEASQQGSGRIIHGLYMEGPYMNADLGANQNSTQFRGPIEEHEYRGLVDTAGDFVRVWCIDPARAGIESFMQYAISVHPDVIFSLGHSLAEPQQCHDLKKYGIRNQTHHADSGSPKGPARGTLGAGPDEYALYDSDIYTELISDLRGIHVRPDRLRLVVKTKGVDRVILITDSSGSRAGFKPNPGTAYGEDLAYDDEGHLAGSRLTLDAACRNMMKHTGYGICHVIHFATINPARMLGIDRELGSLAAGKKANLIICDDQIRINQVILEGETVFQS
ncbi:MAG: amidohydrolase family protein [Clostridiaceae bacterium]|jgi:N-acetylglucosamine-6-phosphate deacetylase|nr:amidohydrolase family protein [Oscillospiraceae bacterium]NLV48041.1 amidohydrolase family protein [Clostridiaceae bacterium]